MRDRREVTEAVLEMQLQCGRFVLDLSQPRIMAVLNVTPDSFSGDGVNRNADAACRTAERACAEGADVLDVGGESSRPGAEQVSEQEELDRVIPVIEALAPGPVPVSVDTVKPVVMREALHAGASMINDINAFRNPGALEAVCKCDAALCVMHMQGRPRNMQQAPGYRDVVAEVGGFLEARVQALLASGVAARRLVLDPGFGFGKTLDHNLTMLRHVAAFGLGCYPVLVGMSRKSMLGHLTGKGVEQRIHASVAAALMAVEGGARIVRVHDVAATRDALCVWSAVRGH